MLSNILLKAGEKIGNKSKLFIQFRKRSETAPCLSLWANHRPWWAEGEHSSLSGVSCVHSGLQGDDTNHVSTPCFLLQVTPKVLFLKGLNKTSSLPGLLLVVVLFWVWSGVAMLLKTLLVVAVQSWYTSANIYTVTSRTLSFWRCYLGVSWRRIDFKMSCAVKDAFFQIEFFLRKEKYFIIIWHKQIKKV